MFLLHDDCDCLGCARWERGRQKRMRRGARSATGFARARRRHFSHCFLCQRCRRLTWRSTSRPRSTRSCPSCGTWRSRSAARRAAAPAAPRPDARAQSIDRVTDAPPLPSPTRSAPLFPSVPLSLRVRATQEGRLADALEKMLALEKQARLVRPREKRASSSRFPFSPPPLRDRVPSLASRATTSRRRRA